MRKAIILILLSAVAAAFLAGCAAGTEATAPPPTETPEATATPVPYTAMQYAGVEVNHHAFYMRHTITDSAFIAEVWEALRFAEWTERDESGQAMVDIEFRFHDGGDALLIFVDPNDAGWLIDLDNEFTLGDDGIYTRTPPIYFDVPAGTYRSIQALLADYSAEHFRGEIETQMDAQ